MNGGKTPKAACTYINICFQTVAMKSYIKSLFLIMVLPPLLAAALMLLTAILSDDWAVSFTSNALQWYGSVIVWLWIYSLPAMLVYALLAVKLKLRRNWCGAAVSAGLGAALAVVSIVLGELFMGDGFVEWGLTFAVAACAAVTMAVMSVCLPKPETAD